jgi:hypothetical protein
MGIHMFKMFHAMLPGGAGAVAQFMGALLLHHSKSGRQAAAAGAASILAAQPGALLQLLDGLLFWMESSNPCSTLQVMSFSQQPVQLLFSNRSCICCISSVIMNS